MYNNMYVYGDLYTHLLYRYDSHIHMYLCMFIIYVHLSVPGIKYAPCTQGAWLLDGCAIFEPMHPDSDVNV